MWEGIKKRLAMPPGAKAPLEICGPTLVMKQGIIKHTVQLDDILWFHTHIFGARYGDRRAVRVILKNKRQKIITFSLKHDIRPVCRALQENASGMLITLNRDAVYKEYMRLYRKDFQALLGAGKAGAP